MDHRVSSHQQIKRLVVEMCTLITNNSTKHVMPRKDVFPHKLHYNYSLISLSGDSLNLLKYIINS